MPCIPLMKSGPHGITPRSAQKIPCKKIEPLKNAALLRFALAVELHGTDAGRLVSGRNDALFA